MKGWTLTNRRSAVFRPTLRVLAAVAAGATLLTGCSFLSGDAPRDESGQVTSSADAGAMNVRLGDCISDVALLDGTVETVPVVPCDQPHQGEVFAEQELTESSLPDDVPARADDFCMGEVVGFLGGEPTGDYANLGIMYLYPTAQSWMLGDRKIQCIIADEEGKLTGSLKGVLA